MAQNEPDFFALAVEIICYIQEGRWYNGKVNTKQAEAVAERLRWGPGTAWWPADQRACREWFAERQRRAAVTPAPTLPRIAPLTPPALPRLPELPRVAPLPDLPRLTPVVPSLPVLPRLK